MDRIERSQQLHHIEEPHHNCCQCTVMPFAESLGLDAELWFRTGALFGKGMRRESVCGAVTGGLMALGLLGAEPETALEFQRRFQERTGALDCGDLLRPIEERGEDRKPFCDRMIATAVELVEELTAGR